MSSLTAWARKAIVAASACGVVVAVAVARLASEPGGKGARASAAETSGGEPWLAVAPGRVEPRSGEIRISAPVLARIGDVLVDVNDKVFAGQPLVRLDDDEIQARLLAAQAQVALRAHARNEQHQPGRTADRRQAEDAVAGSEQAVADAWSALDRAVAAKRSRKGSEADIDAARAGLKRAQDRLGAQQADLRRLEIEGAPLPSETEGQLNVARAEWLGARAAVDKLTIRAPIAGTILQVNARAGELATPSAAQPLLLLGDLSAMRVRAEVDERDFGKVKIGQAAVVRSAAFRGREFAGKVVSIAPLVQPGRIVSGEQHNLTDVSAAEVIVDLTDPGPLAAGMKVDVYFRSAGPTQ